MCAMHRAIDDHVPVPLNPQTRVRLIGDPTRIGVLTDRTRPGHHGRAIRYQVIFPDTTSWVPADQIEPMPAQRECPVDLLQAGKIGRALDLRRTLTHVRLTGRLADVIYSMEMTNTDFYPYQFKPVLRFLQSPCNGLLIADEVGLGKTIEAGLIWTELRSRFDLRRLLVLCPAMLRDKWQRELSHKIGVSADIVNAAGLLHRLKDPDAAMHGFAMICSLEGARPHRNWDNPGEAENGPGHLARFLQSRESDGALIDLLIIDEAHYLRNPQSQTNELGHLFRAVSEHLVLLTATPIHNRNEDLFSLLHLLDADTFQRADDLKRVLEASGPLVKARDHVLGPDPSSQRLVELLTRAQAHPLLIGNRQLELAKQQAGDASRLADRDKRAEFARRLEMINPLAYVLTRTRKRDVEEWRVVRDPVSESVDMTQYEEAFYQAVTDVVIEYAMSRDVNERFILATPQRQMSSSMPATLRAWQRRQDNIDEVAAASKENGNGADEQIGPLTRKLIERAYEFGSVEELRAHDSKYERLHVILEDFFKAHADEKVVLFSTFRETLNYLSERLSGDGITNIVMHGGIRQPREQILRRFQEEPDIRVLLSSEIGSEGIDLQFCRVLVNYDLPWNPMRVEQRIGRLDRLGQKAERILIWNLFYAGTIDARIYRRLYEKLDLCRQALGDFEAILGDEVRKLVTDLLSDHLTEQQQEDRIDQTAQALANLKEEQEQLESEAAHLVAYGDYILKQVQAARDMNRWITGDDLRTYVTDFFRLHYSGCTFRQLNDGGAEYDVKLTGAAKQALEDFIRAERLATPTRLTLNLSQAVRCRFENRTTSGEPRSVELISQFHPLVRFVSASITEGEEQLSPAVSVRVRAGALGKNRLAAGTYLLAISHWSIEGLQAIEKLVFAAARLEAEAVMLESTDAERLANACAQGGTDWFEGPRVVDLDAVTRVADEDLFGKLEEDFKDFVDDMRRQNEDRADLQMRNLQTHLDNQRRKMAEVRERHSLQGRDSLVKATEGRIQKLENRVERQEAKINSRREIRWRSDEILIALVRVD